MNLTFDVTDTGEIVGTMTPEQYANLQDQLFAQAKALTKTKQKDYASATDCLRNYRLAAQVAGDHDHVVDAGAGEARRIAQAAIGVAVRQRAGARLRPDVEQEAQDRVVEQVLADRLIVEIEVPPNLDNACVPCLILQPLVENAIHHSIERVARGGQIDIGLRATLDHIIVTATINATA